MKEPRIPRGLIDTSTLPEVEDQLVNMIGMLEGIIAEKEPHMSIYVVAVRNMAKAALKKLRDPNARND